MILLYPTYWHLTWKLSLNYIHAKQKVRISTLLLPAAGATRSQVLLGELGRCQSFFSSLPWNQNGRKKSFSCSGQAESFLPASSFSFPWLIECQSQVLKKECLEKKELSLGEWKERTGVFQARVSSPNTLPSRRKALFLQLQLLIGELPLHYSCNCYMAPSQTADILFGQASRFLMHACTCQEGYHWAWEDWESSMSAQRKRPRPYYQSNSWNEICPKRIAGAGMRFSVHRASTSLMGSPG